MLEMVSLPEHFRKEMGERAKERAVGGFNAAYDQGVRKTLQRSFGCELKH